MSKPNAGIAGGDRNLFNRPGAGKGDTERNYGWRSQYEGINFHRETPDAGFKRTGANKQRKVYGQSKPEKHGTAPHALVH